MRKATTRSLQPLLVVDVRWGNLLAISWYPEKQETTQGSETSQYLEEKKSKEIP